MSAQCPDNSFWTAQVPALEALLDEILASQAVDERRIYLTGLSMGGFGTWAWGVEHPERFAALAPICGGMVFYADLPAKMCALKDVPVWNFHGAKDPVVAIGESDKLVEALQACGGNVRYTVYPEAEHDSWTETYANPELYAWFLAQTR